MRILFTALVTLCFSSAMHGQCNAFFPLKENVRYEYDHFDRKEKLSFRMTHTFKNIAGSGDNMNATMVQDIFDAKKGEKLSTSELDWKCENGTLHFDMKSMNLMMDNGQQMNLGDGGMSVDVTGDKMDLPSDLDVGQTLKDVTYNFKMTMSGVTLMNRTFNVKERKVESEEDVTTPGGTFHCYKVTFKTSSEGGVGSGTTNSTIWYAKDAGLVKAENYKEDGKLINRQVLTKIVK
jgi:hypothetical protein